MAIIDLPVRFGFSDLPTFKLSRASNEVRGKYTPYRQLLPYPYAVWILEGTLVELDGREAALMRSFLAKLKGKQNTFRLPVPGYSKSSTGYNANGSVFSQINAQATSLVGFGVTASRPIIAEGEYFTVGDECKMATADAASDANGKVSISFEPPARKIIGANSQLKLVSPTILMQSQDDDVASWSIKAPTRQSSKFRAIEAVER